VSNDTIDAGVASNARPGPGTAGAKLRAAREAAGLSVDAVAQQLKLAPRQVRALEEDAWERLPGRTFVRGFARNYARFVRLDPDAVLALLPAADASPALDRPALAASRRPIGEMPVERVANPSALRWLAPLFVVAVVAAVAYYELDRSQFHLPSGLGIPGLTGESPRTPAPATTAPSSSAGSGTLTTTLPNPVAGQAPAASEAPAVGAASGAASVPEITGAATPPASSPASSSTVVTAASPASATPASDASAAAPEASLVLTFKGTSWAEVKDARGRVVLQMTGGAGMTQTVSAVAPLELALGNAPGVDVTFRGQALDLAPYTRGNVARVALK
jgi:cytoskeleton protein RodZ